MRRMMIALVACLLCMAVSCCADTALSGTIRVCLTSMGQPQSLDIQLSGSYSIGDGAGIGVMPGMTLHAACSGSQLILTANGVEQARGRRVMLRRHAASGENGLYIRQARIPSNLYPCDLELIAAEEGIQAIAYLYIEDYLLGVLPYEMAEDFPQEALKAQAVAARTYALRKMSAHSRLYDVVDTTADQVYCGTPAAGQACREAVNSTWGVVGLMDRALMPAYYTASNGGQTETTVHAWGGQD